MTRQRGMVTSACCRDTQSELTSQGYWHEAASNSHEFQGSGMCEPWEDSDPLVLEIFCCHSLQDRNTPRIQY